MFPEYDTLDAATSGSSYFPDLWVDPGGNADPSGAQTQSNDVLSVGVTPPNPYVQPQQDSWSGFWQGLVGAGAKYLMAKDAAKNGLVPVTTPNGQATYVDPRTVRLAGVSSGGWIVIGAIAFAAVLLAEHK